MAILLCAALVALWSTQILDAGFYHDDAITSDFASEALLGGQGAWSYSTSMFMSLVRSQGRCSLAYAFGITPFLVWIGDNLALYRAWHLAWTVLALASFSWSVQRATRDWKVAIFAAAVSLAFFCTNNFHSSLVSYGVVLQQMAVFGFVGVCLADIAVEATSRRGAAWAASSLCVALAALTTEFGLVFVLIGQLVFCLRTGLRKGLLLGLPMTLFTIAYVAATVLSKEPGQYEGAAFGTMQPSLILTTWLKQMSGTIPFTFPLTTEGVSILGPHWPRRILVSISFWLYFVFGFFAFHWLAGRLVPEGRKRISVLGLFGIILITVPASFTSISVKYQQALSYGVSYVQVFVQFMGLALVLTALWLWLLRTLSTRPVYQSLAQVAVAAILASTYASALELNRLTVQHLNRAWQYPRQNFADALSLLDMQADRRPVFVVDRPWLRRWEWTPFAFRHTGHAAQFITMADFVRQDRVTASGSQPQDTYFVSYPIPSDKDADVFIAKIAAVNHAAGGTELHFVPSGARLVRFGPDRESIEGASRAWEYSFGFTEPAPTLQIKFIRPGRTAAISVPSERSVYLK